MSRFMQVVLAALFLALLPWRPAGAQDSAGAGAEGAAAGELATLRTASFQLFPVAESGVSGTLNATERLEGGTQLVVTLKGITPGETIVPVLHRGDCGPDRELLLELQPVGSLANDPYSSITLAPLAFEEISEGDSFLYLRRGDVAGEVVACGEVGAGANR